MKAATVKANPQTIIQVAEELARAGRYAIALDMLDEASLRELYRLLRNLADEKRTAVRKARLIRWRKPV